jgi:hypothetical protein
MGTRQKRRPFTRIQKRETVAAYATFEVGMLWTFVKWHAAPGNGPKKIPVFDFDSNQQTALRALSQELHARQFIAEKAITTLYIFLDALYFPLNTTLAFRNIFHSPVVSFLACRFLTTNGAYISIHNIPPIISKLQYAMRLRGLYKLSGIAKESSASSSLDSDKTSDSFRYGHHISHRSHYSQSW